VEKKEAYRKAIIDVLQSHDVPELLADLGAAFTHRIHPPHAADLFVWRRRRSERSPAINSLVLHRLSDPICTAANLHRSYY
jgi:hypothetical protein